MTLKVGTKIRKIGNGYGVLLPKWVLDAMRLREGDVLTVEAEAGADSIRLAPVDAEFQKQMEAFRRVEPRHRNALRELAK
jgi:putative addiction module antidote